MLSYTLELVSALQQAFPIFGTDSLTMILFKWNFSRLFYFNSGPKGVWTLEKEGKSPQVNISFSEAVPTKCHMALKALIDSGHVQYIVTQNIDGLHLRSGVHRKNIAELHGNMFVENCDKCRR